MAGRATIGRRSTPTASPSSELDRVTTPTTNIDAAATTSSDHADESDERASACACGRSRSRQLLVQRARPDHVEHRFGHQIVQRAAIGESCPKIGRRHLQAWHLDADPVDVVGELHGLAGTIDDDEPRAGHHLVVSGPRAQAGSGIVADDRVQLGLGERSRRAPRACRRCSCCRRGRSRGDPARDPARRRPPLRPSRSDPRPA